MCVAASDLILCLFNAAAASLREQNKALHVTKERLLSTNSELAAALNGQSAQITSLEQQLASAPAPAPLAASDSQAAGAALLPACYTQSCSVR